MAVTPRIPESNISGIKTQIDRIRGNVTDALAAIAAKGVTMPTGSKSDALAELIGAIEAGGGGVTVQKQSGTVTTNSNGAATISCGFKPDVVLVRIATYTEDNYNYDSNLAFVFKEKTSGDTYYLTNMAWKDSTTLVTATATVSNTGCSLNLYEYNSSWTGSYFSNETLSWVAIKYTA